MQPPFGPRALSLVSSAPDCTIATPVTATTAKPRTDILRRREKRAMNSTPQYIPYRHRRRTELERQDSVRTPVTLCRFRRHPATADCDRRDPMRWFTAVHTSAGYAPSGRIGSIERAECMYQYLRQGRPRGAHRTRRLTDLIHRPRPVGPGPRLPAYQRGSCRCGRRTRARERIRWRTPSHEPHEDERATSRAPSARCHGV